MTPTFDPQTPRKANWSLGRFFLLSQSVLPVLPLLALVHLTLTGCAPDAVVGKANMAAAGACGGCVFETVDSLPGCALADEAVRTKYDEWRSSPNQLSAFAGTVWEGRVSAEIDATLTIRDDLSAELYVGEGPPPTPVAGQGFLCQNLDCIEQPFFHEGTYPIYGATYTVGKNENDRNLHFDLNPLSPFDGWCRLQTPHTNPNLGDPNSCDYRLVFKPDKPGPNEVGPCTADGVTVDCKWLEIASELEACQCTSAGCFASTIWAPGDDFILRGNFPADLQYDPDKEVLSGTIKTFQHHFQGEDSRELLLYRVD
jgi:hypothetical protein